MNSKYQYIPVVYLLAALSLLLAVCSNSETSPPAGALPPEQSPVTLAAPTAATTATETVMVDIQLFAFRPATLAVATGTSVTWANSDGISHSVTAGIPEEPAGDFDSGHFGQGERFTFTFSEPGEYVYFCLRHGHIRGMITVTE
jgi:plastocyanin